jgi:hypothetical protein
LLSACAISLIASAAVAAPWKFGVMSDTQWPTSPDNKNPNVAVNVINHINKEFVNKGVKFVVQVGDLTDTPGTSNINLDVRATFAQDLYNAGIGFYPLRGNHESAATAATRFQQIFPQTQNCLNNQTPSMVSTTIYGDLTNTLLYPNYTNSTFCVGSNFSSETGYEGLSYSFDVENARFVLIDTWVSPTGVSKSYMNQTDVDWVGSRLASKPSNSHAFSFAHKGLITENHYDNLFGANPDAAGTAPLTNSFMKYLADNGVRYHMGGHDHMHNRAIVASPDGASKVQNIIASSNSYKFYIPAALGTWNARETQIAQELFTVGYYIFNVDGPKVTVDHYAMPNGCNGDCDQTNDVIPYDTVPFTKHDTFGYSLNGKEVLVAQNGSYVLTDDTTKAVANGETGYLGTYAAILSGTNGSTGKDYRARSLSKSVNTGWASATPETASDILTLWGLADSLATDLSDTGNPNQNYRYVEPDTNRTDTYTLSMTYDPAKVTAEVLNSGNFGLAVKDDVRGWVNAAAKNYGGATNFVIGPWVDGYALGTYGVDPATHTAWAVINHASDFAVAPMNAANIAPVVAITAPVVNAVIDAPANVLIAADATDADGTVAKVEFYNGSVKIGQATTAPFSFTWNGILTGNYTLKAVATDNEGLKSASAPVSFTVNNLDNVLPTVAMTAPADGVTMFNGSTIALSANAADTDGLVAKVEFYNNGVKIGEVAKAPYIFNLPSVAIGNYAFTAVASDNDGARTTSSIVNVSVVYPPAGGTISFFENFDSMGTTGTTPPTGWSIKNGNSNTSNTTWTTSIPANGSNSVASMVNITAALTAITTPTTTNVNGFNAAGDNINNRMLATSPTSVAGGAIQLQLTNNSTGYIDRLKVAYDINRFNAPAAVNELPGYWLFYSLDNGTTWTNVAELNPTVSGPNGVIVPNTIGVTNVPSTLIKLATPWNPGTKLLMRWVDDNGQPTSPDQIYGLDNVSITTPEPLQVSVTTSGIVYNRATKKYSGIMTITNTAQATISGQVSVSLNNLTEGVTLANASGNDYGIPYINQSLPQSLLPGASITIPVSFNNPLNARINFTPVTYGTLSDKKPTQFVYTSDSHYGITRKDLVSSTTTVTAQSVNQALVSAINGLQTCVVSSDPCVGAIDFVANTGDIANRQETGKAAAAAISWDQFNTDYRTGLTVKDRNNSIAPIYLVPGNHDVSNAVGYYKAMSPLFDATSYVSIYNLMMKPATLLTNAGFIGAIPDAATAAASYSGNKVRYSKDLGGVHFVFVGMWPDSATRAWMDADLSMVKSTTPVVIFTHDEPNIETKHLMNPNSPYSINSTNKFENLVLGEAIGGYASVTEITGASTIEQAALVAWLKAHKNVVAYFHGNTNYNEFYNYTGPDNDISLSTFRVDSPMKGMVSGIDSANGIGDPSKLSFQVITIDPAATSMTVREYLWNAKSWGASTTVSLAPRLN